MKGSFVLLSSLLSIAASQDGGPYGGHGGHGGPPNWTPPGHSSHGGHKQIPFNRGVAGTTWCNGFQKGIDASVGCDNGKDKVYSDVQLDDAKLYCDQNKKCLGVTKHPTGQFTPRCGNLRTKDISDDVSWLNKDGCFSLTFWCAGFQQKIDASVGCGDLGKDIIYSDVQLDDAKLYCDQNKKCLGVTKHPDGQFTPRCGNLQTEGISDTVFWLHKDGCFPLLA